MHKILFFDDTVINRRSGVERVFHEPQWMPEHAFTDTETVTGPNYVSIVPSPDGGYYMYYLASLPGDAEIFDFLCAVCLAESDDGLTWRKVEFSPSRKGPFTQVVYDGSPIAMCNCVYYDPHDVDSNRRYKMTDISGVASANEKEPNCHLLYSPDGKTFTPDDEHPWLRRESDTGNDLIYNQYTGKYQLMMRRNLTERLVYCVESDDLQTWSSPRIVFHPGPLDPPMLQFYGMRQLPYEDMFLGYLWRYNTLDVPDPGKMDGTIETELVYSYDGQTWQRLHRPFMACRSLGEMGDGCMYGSALVDKGDHLLVYAVACEPHYFTKDQSEVLRNHVLPGKLRKDGFVSMRSCSLGGQMTTDLLHLRSPELSINVLAPRGKVRMQITDFLCRPLPGYSFDDFESITGDYIEAPCRWKHQPDLANAIQTVASHDFPGQARIQIELEQAEIFSINGDFGLAFHSPQPGENSF